MLDISTTPSRQRTHYKLISADNHVNEPPDVWTARVPARFQDRVPRMKSFDQGDAWIIEGTEDPITFGRNAVAGRSLKDIPGGWIHWEDVRRGGYIPEDRLADLDADGVDAELIYPTPRLINGVFVNPDPDLHLAMISAYNDWMSEFCAYAPDRLGGLMLVPNIGAEAAVREIERVIRCPGIRGVAIGRYPNGSLEIEPEDDRVWGLLAEAGIPVSMHVGLATSAPVAYLKPKPRPLFSRMHDATQRILQFIFSGALDRYPTLQVVFAEVDFGWVPYFGEQVDQEYMRTPGGRRADVKDLPSDYLCRNFNFVYVTDSYGIDNRRRLGVDRVMWSSDYPHSASDWPESWKNIMSSHAAVAPVERELMLAGNAARLYGFGQANHKG